MSRYAVSEEIRLVAAYEEQGRLYAEALRRTEDLPARFGRGESGDAIVQQIADILQEVAAIDRRILPIKRRWEQSACKPSPEFMAVVNRVAVLIQQLSERIQQAEGEAAA